MKTLKNLFFLFAFMLLNIVVFAQKKSQKTLVTTLNLQEAEKIVSDLDGRLEMQRWNKDYIGIYVEVNTNINRKKVIDQLVKNGRYEIQSYLNEKNNLTVEAPNLYKIVTVNNTPLEEEIKFKIYIPKHREFAVADRLKRQTLATAYLSPKN